jgi:hypothetical protein
MLCKRRSNDVNSMLSKRKSSLKDIFNFWNWNHELLKLITNGERNDL